MTTRDKVGKLLNQGKSDDRICTLLNLTTGSLGAYKAQITRENKSKLDMYTHSDQIVISSESLGRLSTRETSSLIGLLSVLVDSPDTTEEPVSTKYSPGSKEELDYAREIVSGLKKSRCTNEEVYEHSKLRGIKKERITAIIAHCTMDRYE
tara:strand:- start:2976 stop:3428 length:453 start_codon:yes stop_codon:yes gene_type:complete